MINGFSTIGAVALQLIEDYHNSPMRYSCRYNLHQAIKVVCFERRSMASSGECPSYLWGSFNFVDGELSFVRTPWKQSGCRLVDGKRHRYIPLEDFSSSDLPYYPEWNDYGRADIYLIQQGLQVGQEILVRTITTYHTDYFGESDSETRSEIIFTDPIGSNMVYMPMPNPIAIRPVRAAIHVV